MSQAIAAKALRHWGLDLCPFSLVAQRENQVFRVTAPDGASYALRLHRPGYQTRAALVSELAWIEALAEGGLSVPRPVPTNAGALLVSHGGFEIDLLTWLEGPALGTTGEPLVLEDRRSTFQDLGALMARVHALSDGWRPPRTFERPCWDLEGLLGETPLWGRFWENPHLTPAQRDLFSRARLRARAMLEKKSASLDYGLIHADMVRENVLIGTGGLALIDFDDSGFGYRLFDVATALIKNRLEPDRMQLQEALIAGYRTVRPLDDADLPLFMALRALTYVGWIVPRLDEPGAKARLQRFVASAVDLAGPLIDMS